MANPIAPECVLIQEGGAILEVIALNAPCYACMLGGEDGRSLFMLTAPNFFEPEPDMQPAGRLLVTIVDTPHAGCP